MHGDMEKAVQAFMAEDHSINDYMTKIQGLFEVQKEVTGMDDVLWYHMFRVQCHDIKHGLRALLEGLVRTLVEHLAHKHVQENARYSMPHTHPSGKIYIYIYS